VGLLLEPSIDLIVALLGTLEAGGAFVPLDPAYPDRRLALLLEDSGIEVLLTVRRLVGRLSARGARMILLDERDSGLPAAAPAPSPRAAYPLSLAYVMYTSGSTGTPKGVGVTHRGIVRLVRQTEYASFGPEEVFLQLAPVSFDASTFEIWGALLNGARLVIAQDGLPSLAELGELVEREGVTTLWLTAGLFHRAVEEQPAGLRGVRQLLAGGEALSVEHVQRALAQLPHSRLINGYGPTENTTFTCCHGFSPGEAPGSSAPIGRPIAKTWVRVVDRGLAPVGMGVAGELWTGGAGLARGYVGRADLTAERFVPDPWGEAGSRAYRTGDLVRWRRDGRLEFLGRVDQQVKVRGFRIEPGEVESVLLRHEGVRQVAVVAVEMGPGDRRLVAYVVGEAEAQELRRLVRESLPDYMVPSHVVSLERLPLAANGKLDRRALPRPEATGGSNRVAPRTATEQLVAGIWSRVLGVEEVDLEDDFFALGGHSLLATQVVSSLQRTFGVSVMLRQLFQGPTVSSLAAAVESLRSSGTLAPPMVRASREGAQPLSFAQERMWFLAQLDPDSPAYHIAAGLRLRGPLWPGLLSLALQEVVGRHEALRTRFVVESGRPVQVAEPAGAWLLPVVDLGGLEPGARKSEAARLGQEEPRRRFDLTSGRLLRTTLLRLGDGRDIRNTGHVLLVTLHHIAADGWSMEILSREVSSAYAALRRGERPSLPPLAVQYVDYSVWQRGWLTGAELERQVSYWRDRLSGAPALLELPVDRPRPAVQRFGGAHRALGLGGPLSSGLRRLCRQEGLTLFMASLTALSALLWRSTGQEDVLVGSPVANRERAEVEGLIGFFANTLVLRVGLEAEESFLRLGERVREVCLEAYAHQDLPFERLVEELRVERSLRHTPLFQVMLVVEHLTSPGHGPGAAPGGEAEEELRVELEPLTGTTAKFDLMVSVVEAPGGMGVRMEYRTDLFDGVTVERLLTHLQRLLEGAVSSPGLSLGELPLLSEGERHQVLVEWSAGPGGEPRGARLHGLLEEQARQHPDAVAVVCEGEHLTYGGLAAAASALARRLEEVGVVPGERVGLCLERSVGLVVGILGVLKAGAAYVPVDPSSPRERLELILTDALGPGRPAVVVTQRGLEDLLPESLAAASVVLEEGVEAKWAAGAPECPGARVPAEALAYVIYTSGSTGRPKGVGVSHGNVLHLLAATEDLFEIGAGDVWTLFHSYAFDFSVWELWGALLYGGRLVVVPYWVSRSPEAFEQLLVHEGVTVLNQTPSAFRQWQASRQSSGRGDLALRWVIFGGEALDPGLLGPWWEEGEGKRPGLINMYGITETTVHASYRRLTEADVQRSPSSPIGRGLRSQRLVLLDRQGQPVPVGVAGELCVGGGGVSQGYVGQPRLTAERFVPDPYGSEAGSRLYRSGDLARYRSDGDLEYLGRIDQQVKIRGFRIEPGEIEAALREQAGVEEAVVMAREEAGGDRRLVAYVVGEAAEEEELRRALRERLPEHMVPWRIVALERLPLTPHGKVDRRKLPPPQPQKPGRPEDERPAWSTPTEEIVAGIWAEVLGLERVEGKDDFFALGGHSLLATQAVSRLQAVFGVRLPLRKIFEAPTPEALAVEMDALRASGPAAAAPPLERVPRGGRLPLSFGQQRLWFLDRLAPGTVTYNMAGSFFLRGPLEPEALEWALDEVRRRHEVLRTRFVAESGEPWQVIDSPRPRCLPLVDLAGLPPLPRQEAVRQLAAREGLRPFDLERGPLLRTALLRLGTGEHVILVTMHHIVSDGWSRSVFLRELAALYRARLSGEPSPLPELAFQYADFAHWQRRCLAGEALAAELGYWKEHLRDLPPPLDLPADRPRPAEQTFTAGGASFFLAPPLTQALRSLARREGATLFMALVCGFATLLSRLSGQRDVVLGTPVAGRDRQELEGLIGFFLNVLVLRADLSGDPAFRGLLGRLREEALGAYAHQSVPFETMLAELQPERDLSRTPLFQILFNLVNLPPARAETGELSIESLGAPETGSKFDLTVYAVETLGGIRLDLVYNADLFDGARIRHLLEQYESLLEQAVQEPDLELRRLSLVTRSALALLPCPADPLDEPEVESVVRLFLAQARRGPDRTALCRAGETWTYGELERWALACARALRARGLRPGEVVAVAGPRSPELIGALLGVLLAGGVLLTLDRRHPEARQRTILRQAGAARLVFAGEPTPQDAWLWTDPGLDVVPAPAGPLPEGGEEAAHEPRPEDPAYLFFTSGTTGIPKGVLGQHKGLGQFLAWQRDTFGIGEDDRCAQLTRLSFDVVLRDVFLPLVSGATLCLPESEDLDPETVLSWLAASGITALHTVPSLASSWLYGMASGLRLSTLRWTFFAGEPLTGAVVRKWREMLPEGARVINLYGPTETTLAKCFFEVPDPPLPGVQPAGWPMPSTQALVLNEEGNLCGIGEPGEIAIRTPFRTLGYLNDTAATRRSFRCNPLREDPLDLLYFTGDRGRYRLDGALDIMGRIDDQVKIRGMRVEPAGVNAVLAGHPAVRESVVVPYEGTGGDRSLAAYLAVRPGETMTVADLRSYVAAHLPDFMVPAAFVLLPALPLTPNGKVDRAALPAVERSRPEDLRPWTAPRDNLEAELAFLFEELLDVRPIGVHDGFFELGGHSLLLVRLQADLERRFGRSLPLARLFREATVAELAAALRADAGTPSASALVPLGPGGESPAFFCVHPLVGWVVVYRRLAELLGAGHSFYGLQARGFDTDHEPFGTIEEMAFHYIDAIRSIQPRGPYRLGGWSFGGRVAFEMARQLAGQGERVILLALFDSSVPAGGPSPSLDPEILDDAETLVAIARQVGLAASRDELAPFAPEERLRLLADRAVEARLLGEREAGVTYLRRRLAVYNANIRAALAYEPGAYDGEITFLRAGERPQGELQEQDPGRGWSRLSTRPVRVFPVPGNHQTLIREHVGALAEVLRRLLAESAAAPGLERTDEKG
jgi:amino acid adenylation domain-containing protein